MKKIVLTSLLFAFAGIVNAQLFVKDGSYVFMTNQYMTVMQDVNLNNTGNFYLRNTSQLLQKGSGASVNSGTGKLSVFQEGTVNNFQYNYWCSPVGNGAAGNPFGVSLLNRPTGLISSTAAEILPTSNVNGTAMGGVGSTMQIAQYWIWKFVSLSPVYANWQYIGNAQTINPGEGFTMKGTAGSDGAVVDADGVANKTGAAQRYDFRGRPNDGNISVAISNGNLTLVGNPYSSAINLNMYLVEHTGRSYNPTTGVVSLGGNPNVIDGSAYFWEHSKTANTHLLAGYVGGYGTYVANGANISTPGTWTSATWNTYNGDGTLNTTGVSTGSNFKRQFSPIGQGFMVKGISAGTSIMKNAYRVFVREGVLNESTFEKNSNATSTQAVNVNNWDEIPNVADIDYTQLSKLPVPQIKLLSILNNEKSIEVAMAFNPNTTDNYDLGYDAISPEVYSNAPNLVYFGQDNNDKKCVITTLPFDLDKRIPIAFKCAAQSTFNVKVSDIINFTGSDKVYIHDKDTDIYYDIINSEFNMSLPAGENATRFEVTFKNADVLSNDNNFVASSFEVFQNNKNSMLTIVNSLGKDVLNCTVYDVAGKLVINKKNLGNNTLIELPTNALSDGVYIVKLNTTDNVSVEKKVIVGN